MSQRIVRQLFGPALILLGLLLPVAPGMATPVNTLVVISADGGVYGEIVRQLESGPVLQPGQYRVVTASNKDALDAQIKSATSIVTIGSLAADAVYQQQPPVPVLSALITQSGFTYLTNKYYGSIDSALEHRVSVIYLDQPLERLYRLGKLILPGSQRIGVVASDDSAIAAVNAFTVDLPNDETLTAVILSNNSSPIRLLNPLMQSSDFVVTLPGKKSIALSAAKWILQIGSHSRTPVIAYSKKYARSGALAAVYTSPENVVEQVIAVFKTTQGLQAGSPGAFGPEGFSIEINATVAGVLGIPMPDITQLAVEIRRMEGSP